MVASHCVRTGSEFLLGKERTNMLNSRLIALLLASAMAFVFAGPASAAINIVFNGDFESTDIGNAWYQTVNAGDSGVTGWTVGGASVDIVSILGGGPGWAHTNNQAIDLAGTPGPGSLSQYLPTTSGAFYDLTFFASSNPPPTTLNVYWDGNLIDSFDPSNFGTWTKYTFPHLQATSGSTLLTFATPTGSNMGPLLDTVSVTAVPEPCSVAACSLLGTVGIAVGRRRRMPSTRT